MPATLIVGTQWGDEGKAKIIDYLSEETEIVVRYQGGANAGHTVMVGEEKYVFHLIPSGILYPNTICVLGGGMVIDPEALFEEMEALERRGIQTRGRIRIADNAHLLLPYHRQIDILREEMAKESRIGTTKRGIGVCYGDKVNRWGIRIGDLFSDNFFEKRLPMLVEMKNAILTRLYETNPIKFAELKDYLLSLRSRLKEFVINVPYYLNLELASGKKVLLEGAQGTMLDVDFGTYPYVTSSNPTTGGAITGSGISFHYLNEVIGITKAYTTRVGEGPFPTEEKGEVGEKIRQIGQEYGATTGRPRRCGWFDCEVVRHAARVNGLTALALTKLDVLDQFPVIKMGIGYELNGKRISHFPTYDADQVQVIYEEFPGWLEPINECRHFDELPKNAKKYIHAIEKFTGIPIRYLSVGPGRDNTIKIR
ncbi:MAG: adenylosuccinate synthase [Leptospiraceae bacterium]|nr:adenylosuccinate synthase [Leptospiraceae bacterium]MDW8307479.1 adenylosuccinate synthase [Leptospiraceae bacterium]